MGEGSSAPRPPLRVYYSVSGEKRDRRLLKELSKWLSSLQQWGWLRQGSSQHDIWPGFNKARAVADKLAQADLVFALLSVDYVYTLECMQGELPTAMARQEEGNILVVPIHLRPMPEGDLPIRMNGKFYRLPRSTWHPRETGQPIDHMDVQQRERAWQQVEHEVRTLVIEHCAAPLGAALAPEELALYRQGDEHGLGRFLDRFIAVIARGLAMGGKREFSTDEQGHIATRLYVDLFCGPTPFYDELGPDREMGFAYELFKLAYIVGSEP